MPIVLFLLVVIAGVLALPFVLIARRRQPGGGTSAVEVITYLILVVATLIATNSISALLELAVPGTGDVIIDSSETLALSLSTLIVAGVVAVAIWIALERRSVAGRARPARDLYLAAVIGFAMGFVAVAVVRLGLFAIGTEDFAISAVADLVSFGGVWFLHERFRRQPEELDELRQLAGAFIGLSLTVAGLSLILNGSLSSIFDANRVLVGENRLWEDIRVGVVLEVVGIPFWWWFWFRGLAQRAGAWRNGYAAVVAVLAWITATISLATALNVGAQWLLGLADQSFGLHFSPMPETLTALLVGGIAYWHHRRILGSERTNVVRAIEYILGAVGLVIGSGSVVVLAAIAIENLAPSDSTVLIDDSRVTLAALITLLLAAAIVARYWVRALRLAADSAEVASPARKATVLVLLIGFAITGAGALIAVLFVLLRAVLEGDSGGVGEQLSWAIPLVVVSGAMAWHLAGLRSIKAAAPVVPSHGVPDEGRVTVQEVRVVTVVASDPGPLPKLVPGMRFLHRTDGVGVVDLEMAERIVQSLASVSAPAALVTIGPEGYSVVPIA